MKSKSQEIIMRRVDDSEILSTNEVIYHVNGDMELCWRDWSNYPLLTCTIMPYGNGHLYYSGHKKGIFLDLKLQYGVYT